MGLQPSKDEMLYQQVDCGNIEGIKALRTQGAGLEWTDCEGRTPLILSCINPELYNMTENLIELGANVNAYRRGRKGGTPLHHAAKRGIDRTVKLLLAHGADALLMNDDCQTALDIARAKGYRNVVRAIEGHLCLFSGWLKELYGPNFLAFLAPQLLSRKVWVVVIPCGSTNPRKPFKLELAIYTSPQDAQPCTIIPLWKANLHEQNMDQSEPMAIISNVSRIPRHWKRRRCIKSFQEAVGLPIKFAPADENQKQQFQQFCDACKGIPQVMNSSYVFNDVARTLEPLSEDEQLARAINASLESALQEHTPLVDTYSGIDSSTSSANSSNNSSHVKASGSKSVVHESESSSSQTTTSVAIPSAPATDAVITNGQIRYPSIDMHIDDAPISVGMKSPSASEMNVGSAPPSCTICLDAPLEAACIPCGHMAGCISCLSEINAKNWGCPVCRAKIDQVVRIYAV